MFEMPLNFRPGLITRCSKQLALTLPAQPAAEQVKQRWQWCAVPACSLAVEGTLKKSFHSTGTEEACCLSKWEKGLHEAEEAFLNC